MELQPGEEPKVTPVQPTPAAEPVIVFDVTKKPKKEISAKHRAQLDAARQSRIAKRKAEREALAKTESVAGGESGSVPSAPVDSTAAVGSGVGGGSGSETATAPLVETPAATDAGTSDPPPAKRHCPDSPAASVSGGTDSNGDVGTSTSDAQLKVIDDPLIADIRAGRKKPMLWSCEGLESLVEYKPPKGKNTE